MQLLQAHLLLEGVADALPNGSFADLVAPDIASWQFRGQVLPEASLVTLTLRAEPIVKSHDRWSVRAHGSLWVDGRRIYAVSRSHRPLCYIRALMGTPAIGDPDRSGTPNRSGRDHRPTHAAPVLPGPSRFLSRVLMEAAPNVIGVDDLVLRRWLVLDRPRVLVMTVEGDALRISAEDGPLANGCLCVATAFPLPPAPVAPLPASTPALEDPYVSGAMFHGPSYQRVVEGRRDRTGADVWLRVDATDARERISHILLDAGLHGIPHDALEQWFPASRAGQLAYPVRASIASASLPIRRATGGVAGV